ncbi:hypothetical protein AGMMS49983_02040 [Clostridia bacterium]|nr:hypothetical protein AGMMS49983_02040 [Clostridia bacterium]
MKKKLRIFAFAVALLLALPGAVFAAPAVEVAAGSNMTVEYRYAEGETPDIPASISQFGQTYHLVGTSDAVLESTLPTTRMYIYRVNGALTPAQLAEIQGAGDIAFTPVYIDREEAIDLYPYMIENLPTNDVEDLLDVAQARGIAGALIIGQTSSVNHVEVNELADISFTPTHWEDAEKLLPDRYQAECRLIGINVIQELGYYLASASFSASEAEGETNQYVIVAEYAPEAPPPEAEEEGGVIVDEGEVIDEPEEPEAALPTVGLSDSDVALVAGQGSNPFANVVDGLVPFGGFHVSGVWSFLSLLLSVAAAIIAIALGLGALARRSRVKNYENMGVYDNEALALAKKRGNLLRALTAILGVITLLTWLLLDDFSVGMVWVNNHTLIVGVLFLITVVLCGITGARTAKSNRYATEEPDTHIA